MNVGLPRFIKSAYRKEPISGVLMTMGVVDAIIGGFDYKWSLFTFGLIMAGGAIALRWWLYEQRRPLPEEPVVQHYLPERSSSAALPVLSVAKKKPRQ